MKIYDTVKKCDLEVFSEDDLIQYMRDGRQVDLYFDEKQSDSDGYLTWDMESWSTVDGKRYIRYYSLEGRVLSEYTAHSIYDLYNDFKPEHAVKVQLS